MEHAAREAVRERTEDLVLGFTIPERAGRGRITRLNTSLNAILAAHDYPAPLSKLLGEALILTAMIGSTLKGDEGQTTIQAKAEGGPVDFLVCDYRAGELRGYLRALGEVPDGGGLADIFGTGYLAVTIDPSDGRERYQGIVDLAGETLCEAAERYFDASEQIPTLLRAAVEWTEEGWSAGGLMVQHLARREEGGPRIHVVDDRENWTHLAALAETITAAELVRADLPLETILWRLFNEDEVRVIPPVPLSRGCRCSAAMVEDRLSTLPESERAEIRGEDGLVSVDCEFCSRNFSVPV